MLMSTSLATFSVEKGESGESLVEARFGTDEQIVRCPVLSVSFLCLFISVSVCVCVCLYVCLCLFVPVCSCVESYSTTTNLGLRILTSIFLLLMLLNHLTLLIGYFRLGFLSSLGLLAWFRHAYFEYHAHVRLRFELASGVGQFWTRDGGYSSGMPVEHDVHCGSVSALV